MLVSRLLALLLYVWALIYLIGVAIGFVSVLWGESLVPLVFGIANLLHAVPVIGTIMLIHRPSSHSRTLSTVCLVSAVALLLWSFNRIVLDDGLLNPVWQVTLALIATYNLIQLVRPTSEPAR